MGIASFDTLNCARKLEAVGFTRQQAETQAEIFRAQAEAQSEMLQKALEKNEREQATKADLKGLATKADLQGLATKVELKELESRLLKWQFGIGVALAAIMAKGFGWLLKNTNIFTIN